MKIDPSKKNKFNKPLKSKSGFTPKTNNISGENFTSLLNKNINQNKVFEFNQNLETTMTELDSIVSEFRQNFEWDVLVRYKNRLRRFLATAMGMFQEKTVDHSGFSYSRKNPSKILVSINIINKNLEEMTMSVLENERKRIELLSKFDMLKGLLRDFKIGN